MTKLERAPTRAYRTPMMDSSRWESLAVRPDDIVIATYPKCGTTWTQRIVDLLVFQDPAPRAIADSSVWLDARIFGALEDNLATLEAQAHRRFMKSHLPLDALPIYDTVKYIHVARDGRDAFMSWHNHARGFRPEAKMRIGAVIMGDPLLAPLLGGGPPPESAAYATRWVAKNIVAAGLAERVEVQVAYAIGKAAPVGLFIETFGTATVDPVKIEKIVPEVFDLRPGAIIRDLDLLRPIYAQTAAYGHFGRTDIDLPWERLDKVDDLKRAI